MADRASDVGGALWWFLKARVSHRLRRVAERVQGHERSPRGRERRRRTLWEDLVGSVSNLVEGRAFDRRFGVDTTRPENLGQLEVLGSRGEGEGYAAAPLLPLRELIERLRLPRGVTWIDLGAGKGRSLLVAAEQGFAQVRGVEFAPDLARIAEDNLARFRARTGKPAAFEVLSQDAATYAFVPEEQVVFLYNPFGEGVLTKVLENLAQSLEESPRALWLIYGDPTLRSQVEAAEFLRCTGSFLIGDAEFAVFRERASAPEEQAPA